MKTKKGYITIHYNGTIYNSDIMTITGLFELSIKKNESTFISFKKDGVKYIFPSNVVKNSVIKITYVEDED